MKKIKVAQAEGPALDWLVAKCEGAVLYEDGPHKGLLRWPQRPGDHPLWSLTAPAYSTDWAQGGPIIERESISILRCFGKWRAEKENGEGDTEWTQDGPTPLVAAMRCYVASRLGETVEVPEELA